MITLYVKTGCPYCAKVLTTLARLNVSYEEKNIADDAVTEELIARGGKRQVPYIVDRETEMYESDAIVMYVEKTYGNGAIQEESKPRIHIAKSTGMCPS
ncbi:MAG: glutathione S-transferase N-terminal domain-containing protein [Minisyncoccia bacterium]